MADPKIYIRRSATPNKVPTSDQLALGELAINTNDGKLYLEKDPNGVGIGTTVVCVNPFNVGVGSLSYDINFTAGDVGIGTDDVSTAVGSNNTAVLAAGIVTAYKFYGDGSALTGISAGGGAASVTMSTSAPSSPSSGDLWWDTDVGELYVYYADGDSNQWVETSGGSALDIVGKFVSNDTGIHTTRNVGIGTTTAGGAVHASNTAVLNVGVVTANYFYGDGSNLTGISGGGSSVWQSSSTGISTTKPVTISNGLNVTGVATARTKLHVGVDTGVYGEDLVVTGDARITGILSIGTETITLDPSLNKVTIGKGITLDAETSSIFVGTSEIADSSGNANYSGIITAGSGIEVTSGDINVGTALTLGSTQGIQFHTQSLHTSGLDVLQINSSGIVTASDGFYVGSTQVIDSSGVWQGSNSGLAGPQGVQGATGSTGPQGATGSAGSDGSTGPQGNQGVQGATGSTGSSGGTGPQGNQGVQGAAGSAGSDGSTGPQGVQGAAGSAGSDGSTGPQGNQGVQGADGNFGGATFDYTFKTATADENPGSGNIRSNNADLSSASKLFIHDSDGGGTDIQAFLRTIDDSTSTVKGHVRISNRLNADDFTIFTISGTNTEVSGYHKVSVSYLSGATSFSNDEDIIVTFARTGTKGDTGAQGVQGVQGAQGAIGRQGAPGPTGNQGVQGAAGSAGSDGSTGPTGPQGNQGVQGAAGSAGSDGSTGPQGNQGVQGAAGAGSDGATGPQGNQGVQGATGSTGPTGPQGASADGSGSVGIQSGGVLVGTASTINFTAGSVTVTNNIASVSVGSTIRFVGARIYHDNYAPSTAAAWTEVTNWDGTSIDTNSFVDNSNGFTIPAGVSKVRFTMGGRPSAGVSNQWTVVKNGSFLQVNDGGLFVEAESNGYANSSVHGTTAVLSVSQGDTFDLRHYLSSTNPTWDLFFEIEVIEGDILGDYFSVAGPQGVQGATGPQGVQGATGSSGGTGPQGNQGVQGAAGSNGQSIEGPTGPQGNQGVQGATGAGGSTGPTGPQGNQGVQGAAGSAGSDGSTGPTGPQGNQGISGARDYTVTNSGSSHYVIDGANDPTLNLLRGFTYTFSINASGHPFYFQTSSGAFSSSATYSTGVTGNGTQVGTITFEVPYNAPSTLYYVCQNHSSMNGTINISDVGPQGNQGVQGAAGSAGSDGSTGPQGNQGVQGAAGSAGSDGSTGPQGVQGATGTAAGGATGVDYNDNVKVRFGTGEVKDLEIYHDGSNSYISDQGTGNLKVLSSTFVLRNASDNAFMLQAVASGAVKLFHNNTNRLETSNDGVIVAGIATATSFVKSGGTSSQYLMADGSVSTAGSGGISNVVEDTTPQLGGDLDLNGNGITGSGTVNLAGIVTTTGNVDIDGNVDLAGTVNVTGIVTATSFVKSGGTSSQYLMADGTVSTGGGTGPQGVQGATGATGPQGAAGSGGGGGSLYYLHVDGTTTQNLSTSAVTLALTSTIATSDSSDFTVGTDGQITVINAGTYFIEYSATGDQTSGNNRIIVSAQLEVNGTVVTGSEADVYSRNTADGDFSAVGSSVVVLAANDVVRVRAFSDSDTLIGTVDNAISGLSMFSLSGAGAQGNQGVQGAAGGPTGPQGNQGVQGAAGSAGSDGSTGPQGNQGVQGAAGSDGQSIEGPTGPQGNQGVQGATGSSGGAGPTGPQGVQGAAGSTGPQGSPNGPTGPQGNQGVQGSSGSGVSTGKAIAMAMIFG